MPVSDSVLPSDLGSAIPQKISITKGLRSCMIYSLSLTAFPWDKERQNILECCFLDVRYTSKKIQYPFGIILSIHRFTQIWVIITEEKRMTLDFWRLFFSVFETHWINNIIYNYSQNIWD